MTQLVCALQAERPRTVVAMLTLVLVLLLSRGWSLAGEIEVTVVSHEVEAAAAGVFYVRIRVANQGAVPVRSCDTSVDEVSDKEPCMAMVYRKGKRPPRFSFSRVEAVDVIHKPIQPGQSVETNVEIPTPRTRGKYLVYVYLVTSEAGKLRWQEFPLNVDIRGPAPDVIRRTLVTRSLLALYVLGTVGMIWWVWSTPRARRTQ